MKANRPALKFEVVPDLRPEAAEAARPPEYESAGLDATDRSAREEILHRAYNIWENHGCPDNQHLAHWLAAESEILRPIRADGPKQG